MNDRFLNKLQEVLDDTLHDLTEKTDDQVKAFFDNYGVHYDEYYAYFLKHHGNDYVKDDYWFICKDDDGNMEQYMVDMLFGLQDCLGNIFDEIKDWADVVMDDVIPIADLPGGDLACMNKQDGSIWFWFHDRDEDNFVMVAESFEEFINGFEKEENEKTIDLSTVKIELDDDLVESIKEFQKRTRNE
ncbi:SMI1/KNR4 family protein [Butyrivibrio sp. AC2005]|uniref:SMI1/KNR4 family protein n=1 Tax=Butyrivibrio sp. AC2005 TaxID=1280672 RepID=UPI000428926A|nr:SMI1/KNR4 family protein [Butyrivibrio sp. AC2005]